MIIDAHGHLWPKESKNYKEYNAQQLYAMDRLGINMAAISVLPEEKRCTPDEFISCNNDCIRYMREHKDRILGYCYVNPGYSEAALREIDRCFDAGMIGVKLYHCYRFDDPVHFPLIEKTIGLGIPVLMHAGVSYNTALMERQPNIAGPVQFLNLIKRYPEAILIEGHIGGGGDWEHVIKGLKPGSQIYADTSGSVVDETLIDRSVETLGIDRLLYANDCSFCDGMGKIMSAHLSDIDKKKIFSGNFIDILNKRKGGSVL